MCRRSYPVHGFAILLALLGLAGCAANPVTGSPDLVLMSEAEEIEAGRHHRRRILETYPVYADPALQVYVEGLGQRLAAHSHRPQLTYRFTVLDTPQVNAFALPGGEVFVHRGLLAYLNSEAELAGVLGHEIGHVSARHAVRDHAKSTIAGYGNRITTHLGALDALYTSMSTALVLGYSREHELEADRLGTEYLARAGYDPRLMLDVVAALRNQEAYERALARAEGREPLVHHGLFASHPDNRARLGAVTEALARIRPDQPLGARRMAYLRRIEGLRFGPGPDQGVVVGRRFLHAAAGVGLQAPPGWLIDAGERGVTLYPTAADAVIQIERRALGTSGSARDLLLGLIKVETLADETALRWGPLRGWRGTAPGATPFGIRPVRFSLWLDGSRGWLFRAASRESGAHAAAIEATIDSFHGLDAEELRLARPRQLRLIRAAAGDTYAALAARQPFGEDRETRLRLLNGQPDPAQQPLPGQWIKIIE